MKKLPNKSPVHLSLQFPGAPLDALDGMRKMLEIHPTKRITVAEALTHPFFEALHNPNDEPVSSRPFDFSFENEKLHRLRLQELIWEEVGDYRPLALPVAPRRSEVAIGQQSSSTATTAPGGKLLGSNNTNTQK